MLMLFTGKDITALRESLGMNLREFGELLGVSEATVSRWESEDRRPKFAMMERFNELAEKKNPRKLVAAS